MLPTVEAPMPALPSEATATDADEPVAPTDADAPAPESAPVVKPLACVFHMD